MRDEKSGLQDMFLNYASIRSPHQCDHNQETVGIRFAWIYFNFRTYGSNIVAFVPFAMNETGGSGRGMGKKEGKR